MTRIIDLPTAGSVDSSTFVPVFQNGKTKKASASSFGGGGGSSSVSDQVHAATIKSSPADADELGMSDSAASWGLKKITFANLKVWIAGMFVSRTNAQIDGNLNITGTGRRITGDFSNESVANRTAFQTSTANGNSFVHVHPNGTAVASGVIVTTGSDGTNYNSAELVVTPTASIVRSGQAGTGSAAPLELNIFATKCMRLDPATFAFTSVNGGIGYGVGAGGTVTQITSKSTEVTLNKPCGVITTSNAALAAGSFAVFTLKSTSISATDVVHACISSPTINYRVSVGYLVAGGVAFVLQNVSSVSLSEAVNINFVVIKGSSQ